MDGYLDYVAEEWMKENELALEQSIKTDISENFIAGLQKLFKESYIEVPDEKVDLVGTLEESVEQYKDELAEQVQANIALKKEVQKFQRSKIVSDLSESLTDTDKERFTALTEDVSFGSEEEFSVKAKTILESFFKNTQEKPEAIVTDTPVVSLEESVKTSSVNPEVEALAKYLI
jgi:hypothetical protein